MIDGKNQNKNRVFLILIAAVIVVLVFLGGCVSSSYRSEKNIGVEELWNLTLTSLKNVKSCEYHEYLKDSSKEAWIKGEYNFITKKENVMRKEGSNISAKLAEIFDFIQSSGKIKKKLIGEEEIRQVRQRKCWVVDIVSNNSEMKIWIEKDSYLPIRINFEEKKNNSKIQRAIDLFNYKT